MNRLVDKLTTKQLCTHKGQLVQNPLRRKGPKIGSPGSQCVCQLKPNSHGIRKYM